VPLYFTQPPPDTTGFSVSETGSPLAVRSDAEQWSAGRRVCRLDVTSSEAQRPIRHKLWAESVGSGLPLADVVEES